MSEKMHDAINSIQPYEKTVSDAKQRLNEERLAAEKRQKNNEEEQILLNDELEKYFGI